MHSRMITSFMCALLAAFNTSTFGLSLAPGEVGSISGTSAAFDPSLNGTIVAQSDQAFDATYGVTPLYSAVFRSTVIRESATGTLAFYYQIINNNNSSIQMVNNVIFTGYGGFSIDADFRSDQGGTYSPAASARSAVGDAVIFSGFSTGDDLFAGLDSTSPMLIRTNATMFGASSRAVIAFNPYPFNGVGAPPVPGSALLETYAPLSASGAAIPEPTSLVLIGLAVGALAARFKLTHIR